MSSLLATHTAVRLARDVGHAALDVKTFYCGRCEAELDWKSLARPDLVVVCPECGTENDLPTYLRPQILLSQYASMIPLDAPLVRPRVPFKLKLTTELVLSFLFCVGTLTLMVYMYFYGR